MIIPALVTRCSRQPIPTISPWYVVRSDDKRRARLNCIAHLLHLIPYRELKPEPVTLPKRCKKNAYDDTLRDQRFVPEQY